MAPRYTIILIVLTVLLSLVACGNADPSSELEIYLDDKYTILWDSTVLPDLNNLTWSEDDGWRSAEFIVYLKNVGNQAITIHASENEELKPRYAIRGFAVSSDKVVLKPKEQKPFIAIINHASWVEVPNPTIYFHIE